MINDPYDNLFDAIERAYELASDSSNATITIKLMKGTHYIKKENRIHKYRA